MNDNTKLELALEIISTVIAKRYREGFDNNSNEIKELLNERDRMYSLDKNTIEEIISKYKLELKGE